MLAVKCCASSCASSAWLTLKDVHSPAAITVDSLPGVVLQEPGSLGFDGTARQPTWTLWGNRTSVLGQNDPRVGIHAVLNRAAAHYDFLSLLAVGEYVRFLNRRYAEFGDLAGAVHGRFSAHAIRALRRDVLQLGLNVSALGDGLDDAWTRRQRGHPRGFTIERSLLAGRLMKPLVLPAREARKLEDELRRELTVSLQRLVRTDRAYRDILSSVASLGASADSFVLGRWALTVAVASLVVALATVLFASVGCDSVAHHLLSLLNVTIEQCAAAGG